MVESDPHCTMTILADGYFNFNVEPRLNFAAERKTTTRTEPEDELQCKNCEKSGVPPYVNCTNSSKEDEQVRNVNAGVAQQRTSSASENEPSQDPYTIEIQKPLRSSTDRFRQLEIVLMVLRGDFPQGEVRDNIQ